MRSFAYYPLVLVTLLIGVLQTTAPAAPDGVTFYFYGAEDCPPCMAFKRDGLPVVEEAAAEAGFAVSANVIRNTRDIESIGVFGATDPILRKAGRRLDRVYPPIFFVTRGDTVLSVHGHDWRAALREARSVSRTATN